MSFNPDQPRDERGRFASDGGGGSSVGKSSGSGPRPVTRGPVQKLSSGHTDATQKTVEQARKYFAKEGSRGKVVGSFGDPRKIAREKYGAAPRRQASESGWQFKLRQLRDVKYSNAAGKQIKDPFRHRYGKPGSLGEFIPPKHRVE